MGYYTEDDKCINLCGDGIVIPQFEQCDDGNLNVNDGCTNCLITQ